LAHYQQADYIYSLADSMGILIWAEIPFVNGYNENADGNALQQLTELIKQNFNHPSIFVWGLHNEVIKNGIVTEAVNLTNKLHNLAKELDPSRYTVAVSNIWWIYDHPIHQLADLQGFNQYTGWYGGKPEELNNWIQKYHSSKPDVRFSVSEYGAGGYIDQQTDDISTPPNPTGQFFPESYQIHYHEVTYSAIEKAPFIWSSYIWNMFDFSVPEWNRGGIKGRNHKGLVTYDRKIKKDAFYWYKANWSDEPVLYLTGRRNNPSETNVKSFTAYSNIGTPELFINGKSLGKMAEGINHVHFVSKEIVLENGENKIEIRVDYDNNQYQDDYELIIETPENE
jgi:beta-galactosidase